MQLHCVSRWNVYILQNSVLVSETCLLAFFSLAVYFTRMVLQEPSAKTFGSWTGSVVNWHDELFETALEADVTSLCVLTGNSWTCLWVSTGVGEGLTRKWCQRGLKWRLDVCENCECAKMWHEANRISTASLSIAFVNTPRDVARTVQFTRIVNR